MAEFGSGFVIEVKKVNRNIIIINVDEMNGYHGYRVRVLASSLKVSGEAACFALPQYRHICRNLWERNLQTGGRL